MRDSCNRGQLDEAVGINSVERFLGDEAIKQGWTVEPAAEPSGKRVLVVGAGPSGLSAAYHLTRLGHEVTIHEAGPMAGGMMRFGIPKYRLPRDVLDAEVQRILDMGVELELEPQGHERRARRCEEGGFDAAFLAVGAHIGKRAYIPAGEAARILDAVSMLRSMEGEEQPLLGRRVVVYGGGNTAMDAARTAKRLGAEEAMVVYRRTRERMPAHEFEVEEAEEEGVMMRWLSTIKQADGGKLMLEKMELDETGFPQPTGELEELEADSVVLALGQEADLSLLDGVAGIEVEDGVVQVGPEHDDRPRRGLRRRRHGARRAHGDGRRRPRQEGRRHIDGWLRGDAYEPPPKHELAELRQAQHLVLRGRAAHRAAAARDRAPPRSTFDEVVGGLDESNALFEARRCLSCGNCFSCDNCYGVCPDNAVLKLGEPGRALRDRPRLLQGLRDLRRGVPVRRDRDGPGEDLTKGI